MKPDESPAGCRFSFIIPFYNCSRYLARAVDSVLAQEGASRELLLVDDGSTDGSADLARSLAAPPGVTVIRQENRGPAAARNTGARHARGEFLWFLDCDDELLPDALPKVESFLAGKPDAEMVIGGHYTDGKRGRKLHLPPPLPGSPEADFRAFLRKKLGSFAHGAVIVKREVFDHLDYPEEIRNNEDLVFHAQVLASHRCATLPEPLVVVHRRPGSLRNLTGDDDLPERITRLLFDPQRLPAPLLSMEREFLASRRLSRFRRLCQAERHAEAVALYEKAVRAWPRAIFRWSYLRKYLRARMR